MLLEKWLLTVQPTAGPVTTPSFVMFGDNTWGQLGINSTVFTSSPTLVGTSSWSAVASGLSHTIAIRSDGKLFTWGANTYGQLGNGDTTLTHRSSPVQIGVDNWTSVSANGDTSYAINNVGKLYAWGLNFTGQMGINDIGSGWTAKSWSSADVYYGAIGITTSGTLFTWGYNTNYQMGDRTTIPRSSPVQIGTSSWTMVGGNGIGARLAITSDRTLFGWGSGTGGGTGIPTGGSITSPALVTSILQPWQQAEYIAGTGKSAYSWTTIVSGYSNGTSGYGIRNDGSLWSWGFNVNGMLGQNLNQTDLGTAYYPLKIGNSSWTAIASAGAGAGVFAKRIDSTLWAWGGNSFGSLGLNDSVARSSPVQVSGSWSILANSGGGSTSMAAIKTDGTLWSWGYNDIGQLGQSNKIHRSSPVQVGTSSWTSVSQQSNNMAAIRLDGALFTWGLNLDGQLGLSDNSYRSSPVQVGTSSWTQVAVGASQMYAIDTLNRLWGWGYYFYLPENYQNGYVSNGRSSPVQIGSIYNSTALDQYLANTGKTALSWISITGTSSRAAIRSDGGLFTWGLNTNGQLGQGTVIHRSSPVQVGTSSWTAVSTAGQNTIAIRTDGTLWAWGNNSNGALGLSDLVHRSSPVQVGTSSWTSVTAGANVTGAISTNNTLWMWGLNTNGQLGDNTVVARSSPVQVGTSSWSLVNITNSTTVALDISGSLFTWGSNNNGQLGINDIAHRSSPVQIGSSSWSAVSSGISSVVGISATRLFAWGGNSNGQLGLNDIVNRSSPVQVGTLSWVSTTTYGALTAAAIRSDGALFGWGFNTNGQIGDSTVLHRSSPVQVGSSSWSVVGASIGNAIDSKKGLYSWGNGTAGELGIGQLGQRTSPTGWISAESYPESWTSVTVNSQSGAAIRIDGKLFTWGLNTDGQLGNNTAVNTIPLTQIGNSNWTLAGIGYAITTDNKLYTWASGPTMAGGLAYTGTRSSPVFIRTIDDSWTSIPSQNYGGIRSDGLLFIWGGFLGNQSDNTGIQNSQPTQMGKDPLSWTYISTSISSNSTYGISAGIRSDGSLFTWGNNTYGALGTNTIVHRSSPVQIGTSSWTMVATGITTMLAIRLGGTLWTWGAANQGEQGRNDLIDRSSPVQVGTSSWTMVSLRNQTAAAITTNGLLYAWGYNAFGQVGNNTTANQLSPVQIGSLLWNTVTAGSQTLGTTLDGKLWAWGLNTSGALGLNDTVHRSSPVQVGNSRWTQLSNNSNYSFGIDANNKLWSWGDNSSGQLGQNDLVHRSSPVQIGTSSWTMVVAADSSNDSGSSDIVSAIRSDSTLWTWGNNSTGGLGLNDLVHRSSPVQVGSSVSWTMIAGRMGFIQDPVYNRGYLYVWGSNNVYGVLGNDNTSVSYSSPVQLAPTVYSWTMLAKGTVGAAAIRTDGTLWAWGTGAIVSATNNVSRSSPVQVTTAISSSFTQVAAGGFYSAITNNIMYAWGGGGSSIPTNNSTQIGGANYPVILSSLDTLNKEISWAAATGTTRYSWTVVAAGGASGVATSYAIRSDGALFTWGANALGQLGDNTILHRSSPVQIGTSSWSAVAAGNSHSYAIRSDGTLFAWGGNSNGELGLNDLVHRSSPVQVGTSSWTSLKSYSTGFNATNSFAIRIDGGLFAWGDNTFGRLGLNDTNLTFGNRSSPVQVGTSSWTQVTASQYVTHAIRTDGTLWGWGNNTSIGNLIGEGFLNRSSPVQIGTSSWTMVGDGSSTNAAIRTDGTLWAWGSNSSGTLGNPYINVFASSPTAIVSFSTPTQQQAYLTKVGKPAPLSWYSVINANNTMIAIRSDNLLFTWGNNAAGGLGLNDQVHRSSPSQVGTSSWTSIAAGGSFAAAIRSDGALFTWGLNTNGAIGDSTQVHRSSPVQIGTSSWSAVAAGPINTIYTAGNNVLAIKTDGSLWAWGDGFGGSLGTNTQVHRSSPVQIGADTNWSKIYNGNTSNFAIKTTGALYAWGLNTNAQLGQNDLVHRSSPVQIGTSSWTMVAPGVNSSAGAYYQLGIRSDGALFSWGNGTQGQLGLGNTGVQGRSSPVQVGTSSWSLITAGPFAIAGISNNLLYIWGVNTYGQFGNGTTGGSNLSSPTLTTGGNSWTKVSTLGSAVAALDSTGQLFTWGGGDGTGVVGAGGTASRSSPVFIRTASDSWTAIGMLSGSSGAIRNDGLLFMWGSNSSGTLGDNDPLNKSYPTQIGNLSWTMVAGANQSLAITASDTGKALFTWGALGIGAVGNYQVSSAGATGRSSPVFMRSINDTWLSTNLGGGWGAAIRSDGRLFTWGDNTFGKLGDGTTEHRSLMVQIGSNTNWTSVVATPSNLVAINSTSQVYVTGQNNSGELGVMYNPTSLSAAATWIVPWSQPVQIGSTPYSNSPAQIGTSSWSQVSAGVSHALGITNDKKLFAWGYNSSFQIDQSGIHRSSPTQIGSSSWTMVSAGNAQSLAIAQDNSLYGWGQQYQLWQYNPTTTGTFTNFILPTTTTVSWSIISGGYTAFAGVRSDGSLWTWGLNSSGELGTNDLLHRSSPVQIGTSSWTQVSANYLFTTAVRTDGTLWSWGLNTNGELGLNDLVPRSSPVQIGTNTNWSKIGNSGAITNTGILYVWGVGSFIAQNEGTMSTAPNRSSPVQLGTSSWTMVSGNYRTGAGITTDGLLFTWGWNTNGQIGTNDLLHRSSPVQVTSIYSLEQQNTYLTNTGKTTFSWSQLSTNGTNGTTAAIRSDGALFTWGDNTTGQLGISDTTHRSSPVQIGVSSWTQISVGNGFALGITTTYQLFSWGNNNIGQLGLNNTTASVSNRSSPNVVGTSSWSTVFAGASSVAAITVDGKLFTWGLNTDGQLGSTTVLHRSSPVQVGTSSWTTVNTNTGITSAIRIDGALFTWGINTSGQLGLNDIVSRSSPVQLGTGSWSAVAAGQSHIVAISNTNTLWSWGLNTNGQLGLNDLVHRSSPVQIGTSSWSAVTSGQNYSMAIRSDNTLWGFGVNTNGQIGDNTVLARSSPVQVGTSTWFKISGVFTDTVGIENVTKQLFVWGLGTTGAIGNNSILSRSSPVFIRTVNDSWTMVITNGNPGSAIGQTAAIRSDGLLWTWGYNTNGQLGLSDLVHRSSPVQIGTTSWSQVSVGWSSLAGITNNLLYTWGNNTNGQLGLNDIVHRSSPSLVGLSSWSVVSLGSLGSTYSTQPNNLVLYGWGYNTDGELGDNSLIHRSSPVQISSYISSPKKIGVDTWRSISAGYSHNVGINTDYKLYGWGNAAATPFSAYSWNAITASFAHNAAIRSDGALFTWGSNGTGNLGDNTILNRSSPVQIGTSSWTQVSAGGFTSGTDLVTLALDKFNVLYGWGAATLGQLGQNNIINKSSPVQISSITSETIQSTYLTNTGKTGFSWSKINTGGSIGSSAAIRSDGALFTWGANTFGQLGQNSIISTSSPVQVGTSSWSQLSVGNNAMYAIRNDNTLWSWGLNTIGQLGLNDLVHRSSPVQIGTSSWTMIHGSVATASATSTLACVSAIRSDGGLFTWGNNNSGQLGDNTLLHRSSPVQIGTSSWTNLDTGDVNAYAIRLDGALFTWGLNNFGQLGLNDLVHRSSPVQIGTSSWTSVAAGSSYAMGIEIDGTLYGWGANPNGQLGLNDLVSRSSPVQVGTSSWTAISTGLATTNAILLGNTLWGWGINTNGQIGDNTVLARSSPVQIGTNSWSQVSAGTSPGVVMALSNPGNQLYMWGINTTGQLGTGENVISKSSPIFIRSINDSWNIISSGGNSSYGVRIDNMLFAWGDNSIGQLGLNDLVHRSNPVQVGTSSWSQLSAGISTVGAIASNGILWMWGQNNIGQLGDTTILHRSSPVQIGTSSWSQVSAGKSTTAALNIYNLLFTWGSNTNGALGQNSVIHRSSPVQVGTSSWTSVVAGSYGVAIRSDGYLFVWGHNAFGQLGLNDILPRSSPVQVGTATYTNIGKNGSTTGYTTMAITSNILFTWGNNASGQMGNNTVVLRSSPVQLGLNQAYAPPNLYSVPTQIGTSSWTQVAANYNNTFVTDSNNVLYEWGFNDNRPLLPAITSIGISARVVTNGYNHFGAIK